MADEMTPRPEIQITDEEELDYVVEDRKLLLERIKMEASIIFESIFEAWRRVHRIRMGTADEYVNHAEYLKALEDPDPYESTYIFYCLGK